MQSYCKEEAQVSVIPLSEAHAGLVPLVGGKAAGLGELIRAGERVPDGFCVTTEAYRAGVVPQDEVRAAYARLGGGPVAVRSSATDEDLPDASFAGQHDTVLDVEGEADLVAAIDTCWKSLHGDRAAAYREAHGTDPADARMAVVVQRMVAPARAGVLYTANPVTGSRTEMLVDVGTGLGTRVVDGHTDAKHLVLTGPAHPEDGPAGAAGARRGAARGPGWHDDLWTAGRRVQAHFGVPQDVEWAIDHDGTLWLLQSRPVTTLFPLPPQTDDLRVYVEFGNVQGMLRPVTPMGMSTLSRMIAAMVASLGMRVEIVDIGGRLYGDLTDLVRRSASRRRLVRLMAVDFGAPRPGGDGARPAGSTLRAVRRPVPSTGGRLAGHGAAGTAGHPAGAGPPGRGTAPAGRGRRPATRRIDGAAAGAHGPRAAAVRPRPRRGR